jgi:cell division protein FtsZ
MGSGISVGENRAVEAADRAIHSPLLDDVSITGATGVLVNITGGDDLGMLEINDAMNYIHDAVGKESNANIIFGTVINNQMEDEVSVTVIATGFGEGLSRGGSRVEREFGSIPAGRFSRTINISSRPADITARPSTGEPIISESIEKPDDQENTQAEAVPQEEKTVPEEAKKDIPRISQLGHSAGKYNPMEHDVDYETPAFLRYPSRKKE